MSLYSLFFDVAQTVENMAVEHVGKGKQKKKGHEEEAAAFLELLDKVLSFILSPAVVLSLLLADVGMVH